MKIIMGNVYQQTPDATSVTITNSASDPIPTCQFSIYDNNSSLSALEMQEVLILDDVAIPNPTINLLQNPTLNPISDSHWTLDPFPPSGITYSQHAGGGLTVSFANDMTNLNQQYTVDFQTLPCIGGQAYCMSATLTGSSPVNIGAGFYIFWYDANFQLLSLSHAVQAGPFTPTGTPTVISAPAIAPSTAAFVAAELTIYISSFTNSGSLTFTNVQFEPEWFPTQSYPTPFCGPSQTNCRQLPLGFWIRQYRKFAGFVTGADYGDYKGNVRTINVSCSGYAFLLSLITSNKTYTSQYDSAIFINLLNTYLVSTDPVIGGTTAMCTTTNVVQGVQLSNFVLNWDDLRTAANNLASQIGFTWGIDYYWNAFYAPPGYFSSTFRLSDKNAEIDNVTVFPMQNFNAKMDFTQPGSNIIVLGNGSSNTAQVIDPVRVQALGINSGYFLPTTTSYMRKVNESSLNSVADCTNRAMAELLQYDYARHTYTLTTDNVELVAGYAVQVTSITDNLTNTTLILQQVTATWQGTNELLQDVWIYDATLGAYSRTVTSIMSRLFRATNANTSAPSINTTTLVAFERIGITDVASSTTTSLVYQAIILNDGPVAYYRLGELLGTIADDFSGNAYNGTLHGTITLGVASLLLTDSDTAMTLDGSTGYISLPTGLIPTGAHAWSLECWCSVASLPAASAFGTMVAFGKDSNQQSAQLKIFNNAGNGLLYLSTFNGDIHWTTTISTGTTYHVVGAYDGTNTRLYVNGALVAGPSAFTLNIGTDFATIGANGVTPGEFFNGTVDEATIWSYALDSYKIPTHYARGSSLYAATVLLDSPIAYYRLTEPSGASAYDISRNNYAGTITGSGVTYSVTGPHPSGLSKAMTFNGSTGEVTATVSSMPTGSGAWSIEAWINLASFNNTRINVIASIGTWNVSQEIGLIAVDASQKLQIATFGNNYSSTTTLPTGSWHHVVGTYDGTNMRLYYDGSLILGPQAQAMNLTGTSMAIASTTGTIHDQINATICDVAIYNYALSASQVSNHYTVGTT